MKNNLDITKFTFFLDNVLIKAIQIKERDGIVKPSSYEDKPELGEVIAFGKGRVFDTGIVEPIELKKGDIVLFNRYSATKYNFDGVDHYVVRIEDVVAKQ